MLSIPLNTCISNEIYHSLKTLYWLVTIVIPWVSSTPLQQEAQVSSEEQALQERLGAIRLQETITAHLRS